MIKNHAQLLLTADLSEKLTRNLEELIGQGGDDFIKKLCIDAISSQLSDLNSEIADYQRLVHLPEILGRKATIDDVDGSLVKLRIASGIDQSNLAEMLNISVEEVLKFEDVDYLGCPPLLKKRVVELFCGSHALDNSGSIEIDYASFPIKEMIKKGWVAVSEKKKAAKDLIQDFLSVLDVTSYQKALHRKSMYLGKEANPYALLAWQARVQHKADWIFESGSLKPFSINDKWVRSLVELSVNSDAPLLVKEKLEQHGIIFVVEEHLTGTYLDGATLIHKSGHPILALTLRHDRLDNFWFVLMHELAHIYMHLFSSTCQEFFDDESFSDRAYMEAEADKYALDFLIPQEKWDECISRFSPSESLVAMDAANLRIHPAIIAGRIRRESGDYKMLANLVGSGEVRKYFK